VERRLAAILVADVVGYSRLMGEDEAGTLERLKSLRRELVQPKIMECNVTDSHTIDVNLENNLFQLHQELFIGFNPLA
jgi:class 3 adenylate cyclase